MLCSAQCRRRWLPLGPGGCLFSFITHCENIPLSVYSLISHLFVCLLIILLLEQNMQWMLRLYFCEKQGPAVPQGRLTYPEPTRRGHERNPQEPLPLAWALELSGGPGTPDLIKEGLSCWRFKRKHLKPKESKGAPQTRSSPFPGPSPVCVGPQTPACCSSRPLPQRSESPQHSTSSC